MVTTNQCPTSVRLLKPFIRLLLARGVELFPLIRGLGLKPDLFSDPDARIPWNAAVILLERAVEASGDRALGLHAAEYIHPGDFDALELVARASGTRRGALAAVSRYAGLMTAGVSLAHSVEGANEAWTLTLPPPNPPVAVEFALGIFVVVGRSLSDGNVSPDEIQLASAPVSNSADYARVFGCPVRWSSSRNALILATERLDRKISHVTPSLALTLQQHAEKLLSELPNASAQSTRVREQILEVLRTGPASPEEVCRRLKMSKRTLRRRLQQEGRTFSDLLSEVRRELAHRYLDDPNRSITEVAFLLGFADTSAFQRAFRRWYGVPPSAYRRGTRQATER